MPDKRRHTSSSLRWRRDEAPFRLGDLPPEIRIFIFEQYLRWRIGRYAKKRAEQLKYKRETSPSLIKALRPVPQLYAEALEIYYELSTMSFSKHNMDRVKYLPYQITERARSLELWYGVRIKPHAWELELVPSFPIKHIFRFANVRQVYITTNAGMRAIQTRFAKANLRNILKQTIIQLPHLQILTLEMPAQNIYDSRTLLPDNPMRATAVDCSPLRQGNMAFRWDAGEGRALTWTDDTHWRSIPWAHNNVLYVGLTNYHQLCFWAPVRLHFLGMNPRPLLLSCADDLCNCAAPGQDWHLNEQGQLTSTLQGSFGEPWT